MFFGDHTFAERANVAVRRTSVILNGIATLRVELEFRIFAATEEFVTRSIDQIATQPFYGTLLQPLSFKRTIIGSDIIGRFTAGSGELELTNTDGEYDFLIQRYAIDGRDITVKIGTPDTPYDDFYTIFSGTAADWSVEEDVVRIELVDNGYKLSVPAQPNVYGGTGDLDGTSDLAGKRKPRSFGYVKNVSAPLVIPGSLTYQINDGPVEDITAVYDRGVSITKGVNYASSALLLAATISPGAYATCLSEGLFRLNTSPSGTITADVSGDKTGGEFVTTTADIVRRLVTSSSVITDENIYLPSFDVVNESQPSKIGYWIAPDDNDTVADVASRLMSAVGGWCGFRRNGTLEVGIFVTPQGATQAASFDRADIISISREKLPSSLTPPPYRFRVGYQRNWTKQTDTAGSVSASRKGFLAEEYRYADSANDSVLTDHPFAQDHAPVESFFNEQADAQDEADRQLELYRGTKGLYRMTVGLLPFALDLGQVINVRYPRWDLTVGRKLRIVEMNENARDNTVEVVGYG